MSVIAPPPQDELELLIREARARQRRRWMAAAGLIAGAVLAGYSIAGGSGSGGRTAGAHMPSPIAAARHSGRRISLAADRGLLQRFAPQSATTWWAIVESNLHAKTWVVRTTDSGRHWQAVTPPVNLVASSAFHGTKVAWVEAGALRTGRRAEPVYRTLDGGRTWKRLSRVSSECQLGFVDLRHGWCISIDAAAGSEGVWVYRTSDGGSSWRLVSRTWVGGSQPRSTPGALPFGCDKTIGFTAPRVGWAAQYCNSRTPFLCESTDGGAHWHHLAAVPLPKGLSMHDGGGLGLPAVEGSRGLAVSLTVQSATEPTARTVIATSTNDGASWHSHRVPGKAAWWAADLVSVRSWRLSDGRTLLETNDAGRHWRRLKDPSRLGSAVAPDFLSNRLGFALPDVDGFGGLWRTHDGGTTWKRITITAGPFTLGR
ncbi:MAG: WD40/YVTN/BNR-like repeat-containing protein [Gaiellaceae bacterium]